MIKKIKQIIVRIIDATSYGKTIKDFKRLQPYFDWLEAGKPVPPPDIVKQMIIKEYLNKYMPLVFFESGTYLGGMVNAVKTLFDRIYSIELSKELCEKAQDKFIKDDHISIVHGDSADIMPGILEQIDEACLFWLDGHYSKGITAKGIKETPIAEELEHIFTHHIKTHVILIDDARYFNGKNDYPTIDELFDFISEQKPEYKYYVENDIIRIHI